MTPRAAPASGPLTLAEVEQHCGDGRRGLIRQRRPVRRSGEGLNQLAARDEPGTSHIIREGDGGHRCEARILDAIARFSGWQLGLVVIDHRVRGCGRLVGADANDDDTDCGHCGEHCEEHGEPTHDQPPVAA